MIRELSLCLCLSLTVAQVRSEEIVDVRAVQRSFDALAQEHDRNQAEFVVCDDRDSGFEHFFASGWMGDLAAAPKPEGIKALNTAWTRNPRSGHTCVRLAMPRQWQSETWGGLFWEYPEPSRKSPGYDLTSYVSREEPATLRFWARQATESGTVTFSVRGVYGSGATARVVTSKFQDRVGPDWKEYRHLISPTFPWGNVTGGFAVSASNLFGAVEVFVDDVAIEFGPTGRAQRLNEPRFLRSYTPLGVAAPDKYFRNACYSYDNALYLIALCARGRPDDLRRAKLIADAFLIVQKHDPIGDGRIRNGYMCGELLDRSRGSVPRIPGFWDDAAEAWREDRYCVQADCGNIAWTALALLEFRRRTGLMAPDPYLDAVLRMMNWVVRMQDTEHPGGYRMGMDFEPVAVAGSPLRERAMTAKSCEHNIDLYAAFRRLGEATGDRAWDERAEHARRFVEWLAAEGPKQGFATLPTGTGVDGKTLNLSVAPLDVNPWALFVFRDRDAYREPVRKAHERCFTTLERQGKTITGYDFNEDRDGVWWEGTSQMALAFRMLGDTQREREILAQVQAQAEAPLHPGLVSAATTTKRDRLSTGFFRDSRQTEEWVYWPRAHAGGATCWWLFAALGWNPYWGEKVTQ